MNLKRLMWNMTIVSFLTVAWTGVASAQHEGHGGGGANTLPDSVRDVLAPFRDLSEAIGQGYVLFQGCVSGPNEGAMGVHYVNPMLFDDQLDVEHPEALVYEPRNGRLVLAAAEYITPADAWGASHAPGDQPALAGHLLNYVPGPNRYGPGAFYEIHVWALKTNPKGVFADWNTNVSCASWAPAP
jgi:hypothetical protein